MGRRHITIVLAAGLCLIPAHGSVYADDMLVPDTEEVVEEAPAISYDGGEDLVSSDGLFEVVSESSSKEGKTLEDVIPAPQVTPVPASPPSPNLTVETLKPNPGPFEAMADYLDEYLHADYRYYSDTLFYTCTKHETEDSAYYLTHIVVKDAKQICGEDSEGDFGGARETPKDAASRTGAKLLINGSYFDYGTGYATGGELLIRDNKVIHGEYSDGYEICLRRDGTLFSPGYNTVSSVLAQDVVFSWGTCEDLLIRDGEKCVLTDYDWNGNTYPRTAVGMVRPLEYYIITAGGADYSKGITVYDEQEIFSGLGCAYARGLDGGGSSALVIDGEYVNENGDRLADGTLMRRAAADFLLFRE